MEDVKLEVEDEEETSKPKAKNPLDLLPPNEMILDEWKRLYSNTKTNSRGVAIKGSLFIDVDALNRDQSSVYLLYLPREALKCPSWWLSDLSDAIIANCVHA
ncbi:elongation factor 1-gamma 2-like [Olea europaea subsp. europaea]|uniref:Elongation factor 1-gamma 2-like n=1 Tax=Olea europaea subsp. europaea TaxID=158383 RepID=A0A8S0UI58_OLEEU|nr:elongation factor 1-gamma 2-like [Olea europaea subsp. europaea]